MNRDQFDHAVRAAAAVAGVSEVIVIGSQAVHASLQSEIPVTALRSVEADMIGTVDVPTSKQELALGLLDPLGS